MICVVSPRMCTERVITRCESEDCTIRFRDRGLPRAQIYSHAASRKRAVHNLGDTVEYLYNIYLQRMMRERRKEEIYG